MQAIERPVAELTREQKALTVTGMLLAMLLAALDQTVVATAGPAITRALSIDPGFYSWMTTAYLVASTVLVPIFGKLSDLYGRKRVVLVGIALFLLGSLLCGVATDATQLFASRALQGAGAASIFTSAFAVLGDLFSPAQRGRYSGVFGAVFGVASLVGPLLGGWLTDTFGWRWVFFINLPIGAVALAFVALRMPPLAPPPASPRPRVDVAGGLLLTLGVVPLLLALSLGHTAAQGDAFGLRWTDAREVALFGAAAASLAAFTWWELRVGEPLVDLRLFRDPTVRWGLAATFMLGGAFLTPMIFLPLFMVNVVGVTATASGLTISPMVLGVVAGNVLSGQLVSRLGTYKGLMLGSLGLLATAFAVLALSLDADASQASVTAKMVLLGLGLGPSVPLYTLAIQSAAPAGQLGAATSMTTFFRQLGGTVGLAVAGALFASTLDTSLRAQLELVTRGLPAGLVEQLVPAPGAEPTPFDAERVKQTVRGKLEGARVVARKAINGETLASALVANSPLADERLKAIARAGGVRAQVKRSFEALSTRVMTAASSPERWTQLAAANDLPVEVTSWLRSVPPESVRESVGRANVLTSATQVIAAAELVAERKATEQALAELEDALQAAMPRLLAAVDTAAVASKVAFADAMTRLFEWSLGLVLVAMLLTSRLPRVTLQERPASASTEEPPKTNA
jgi:EmrB/QacA subfamily drug resistance transporter